MKKDWAKNKPRGTSLLTGREDEFLAIHKKYHDKELACKFGVGICTIARWRKKLGIRKESAEFRKRVDIPDSFIEDHQIMNNKQLADKYNKSLSGIEKWINKLKLKKDQKLKWTINEHPRGFLGGIHSQEALNKMSEAGLRSWKNKTQEQLDEHYRRASIAGQKIINNREKASWKSGWREFGGKKKYYRSRWESNYGRYLQWLKENGEIKDWEHESDVFWFKGIKRGCMSYKPDFKVIENNNEIVYHEVKGWMDDRSKTKIKRMAIYYPNVKLIVIDSNLYKKMSKKLKFLIPGWE